MLAIANGDVDVTTLHTGTVPLSELPSLLEDLAGGKSLQTKALIDPRI
jgi:hypothetical protein